MFNALTSAEHYYLLYHSIYIPYSKNQNLRDIQGIVSEAQISHWPHGESDREKGTFNQGNRGHYL